MKNRWDDTVISQSDSPLKIRVYTSRLLGQDEDLVLHGGGNTSVKVKEKNIFGEEEDILYVKGSGWDLASIEEAGFAPVKLKALLQMATLPELNDLEMVKQQRIAMINPAAPNPSVEAILHAIIPFQFVDHTHADAVVTISNTPGAEKILQQLYGDRVLLLPYVMPGFVLAKQVYELSKKGMAVSGWKNIDAIILLHHGVITFDDDARKSYEKMIAIVTRAEEYIEKHAPPAINNQMGLEPDTLAIARLRKQVSALCSKPMLVSFDNSNDAVYFSSLKNVADISGRGPLTPDHIIRTKRTPLVFDNDMETSLNNYAEDYNRYFEVHHTGYQVCLDKAPRWAVWQNRGLLSLDHSMSNLQITKDIYRHTIRAVSRGEKMGGWQPLPEKDLFDVEYWSLEQEKLKKAVSAKSLQGKIALVTGAASGIGKACVEKLVAEGAVVAALDINPSVKDCFTRKEVLSCICDVTNKEQLQQAVQKTISSFGGLDMLVSNAGIFPESSAIADMKDDTWEKSIDINLNSHLHLLKACLPYLKEGIQPAVVIIGSRNVQAPGPGASAYSVAKAGLNQLGRIAALELGKNGIRVNMLHPNAVFDTGIWSDEVLEARARHYGLSVQEYKTGNVLQTEVTSNDVAVLAVLMLGAAFSKTTGAQVPVDGGNERVI
ncbi:MAG TPA: bifunctional aldolase/short-chain dehydrogenase [Chitinophagaceae bacterium]|nr:bifunctional aldolase/short-chain dehydrogenase [Chitinophagaceae bacterium]